MNFRPHLTPIEMITDGVFGGSYFSKATEEDFASMTPELEALARTQVGPYRKDANAFGVRAGDSYDEWRKRGWLFPEDPLGWFHWYCRFWSGRRHQRDEHQIGRHLAYKDRWGKFARTQHRTKGHCSPVVKQSMVHWALAPPIVIMELE